MFSGGSYSEVGRWLRNFLASHSKREDARVEVLFDAEGEHEGVSYAARLRLGDRVSAPIELRFDDAAVNRGRLVWCKALADRTRGLARELVASADVTGAQQR